MSEWNNYTFEQFVEHWKTIRADVPGMDKQALEYIIASFPAFPIASGHTIDPYAPAEWPTPWDQIKGGLFCYCGIGLFFYYTILLSTFESSHMEIWYMNTGEYDVLCPVLVDANMALDVETMEIIPVDSIDQESIIKKYKQTDLINVH